VLDAPSAWPGVAWFNSELWEGKGDDNRSSGRAEGDKTSRKYVKITSVYVPVERKRRKISANGGIGAQASRGKKILPLAPAVGSADFFQRIKATGRGGRVRRSLSRGEETNLQCKICATLFDDNHYGDLIFSFDEGG